jgi:hypothetical protein
LAHRILAKFNESINCRVCNAIAGEIYKSKKYWAPELPVSYGGVPSADIAPLALSVPVILPLELVMFSVKFCAITTCSMDAVASTIRLAIVAAHIAIANITNFVFAVTI